MKVSDMVAGKRYRIVIEGVAQEATGAKDVRWIREGDKGRWLRDDSPEVKSIEEIVPVYPAGTVVIKRAGTFVVAFVKSSYGDWFRDGSSQRFSQNFALDPTDFVSVEIIEVPK